MFREEIKNIKSSRKDLRNFGLAIGTVLFALGVYFWFKEKPSSHALLAIGVLLAGWGALAPSLLKLPHKMWMAFGIVLGWLMTNIILTAFFYAGMTPLAWIARLAGKRFLDFSFRSPVASYWNGRNKIAWDKTRLEKQF